MKKPSRKDLGKFMTKPSRKGLGTFIKKTSSKSFGKFIQKRLNTLRLGRLSLLSDSPSCK